MSRGGGKTDGLRKTGRSPGKRKLMGRDTPSPLRVCRVDQFTHNSLNPRIPAGLIFAPRVVRPVRQIHRTKLISDCDYFPGLPRSPTGGLLQREAVIRRSRGGWSDHSFAPVAGRVQAHYLLSASPGQALQLRSPSGPDCPSPHIFLSRSYTRRAASSLCSF